MRSEKEIQEALHFIIRSQHGEEYDESGRLRSVIRGCIQAFEWVLEGPALRPLDEWNWTHGGVLWYRAPIRASDLPWAGRPSDDDWPMEQPGEPWATHFLTLPDVGDGGEQ